MDAKQASARATEGPEAPALVSACLLGRHCRYDGRHNADAALERELEARGLTAVPYCPEEEGGLGTPRPPAWIEASGAGEVLDGRDRIVRDDGTDVTEGFLRGARGALALCEREGIRHAFLKERSPSCGVASTHVDGKPCAGRGVTAELLARHRIDVHGVEGRRS